MPLIDPDGMFGGERIAKLSDAAKLYWPWLYSASNGYGRIELNYRKVRHRVFSSFEKPPNEEEFYALVNEYREAFLLFVYTADGQIWGQWDTSERWLRTYKTAADKISPAPPQGEWLEWKKRYATVKTQQVPDLSIFPQNFQKVLESSPRIGVGKGNGRGEDKNPFAQNCVLSVGQITASASGEPEPPATGKRRPPSRSERERWFHQEFWPVAWIKVDKAVALREFVRAATTVEAKDSMVAEAKRQGPLIVENARNNSITPMYLSTWIRKRRWEDDPEALTLFGSTTRGKPDPFQRLRDMAREKEEVR